MRCQIHDSDGATGTTERQMPPSDRGRKSNVQLLAPVFRLRQRPMSVAKFLKWIG